MTVNVLWVFLTVPLVGLQCAIVVFPDHTHLLVLGAKEDRYSPPQLRCMGGGGKLWITYIAIYLFEVGGNPVPCDQFRNNITAHPLVRFYFIKIISHYKKIGYNINVLQQTVCLVVNPITVGNFAFLFNCTPVGRTSDSMMVPT